ncbi:MAG: hypothetical protein DMG38_23870 [Acidobacteria bacterium]|nr:MAG: hypothetical protein DMG38_23870 [Acidobacteriota bacterium]
MSFRSPSGKLPAAQRKMSEPAASRHVRVLVDSAQLSKIREGRHRWCRLIPSAFESAGESIEKLRSEYGPRLLETFDNSGIDFSRAQNRAWLATKLEWSQSVCGNSKSAPPPRRSFV